MKIKKIINKVNKWLKDITNLLTNVFMFAVISGLFASLEVKKITARKRNTGYS